MTRPGGSTRPHHEEIGASRTSRGGILTIRWYSFEGMSNRSDTSLFPEEHPGQQHQDCDDGANDLWSLYGKEAQIYDESRMNSLKGDMKCILIFVRVCFHPYQPEFDIIHSRLVYSPVLSRRSSSQRSRIGK